MALGNCVCQYGLEDSNFSSDEYLVHDFPNLVQMIILLREYQWTGELSIRFYLGHMVHAVHPAEIVVCSIHFRAAEIINYPKIALDFCADSRRGKGRIAVLCNPCRNAEAAQKDKQDGIIYYFRGPYVTSQNQGASRK